MFRLLLVSAALCTLGSPVARAETLDDTLASALTYNPSLETAKAGKNIAHEDKVEQASNYYPQLSSYVAGGRIYGDNATSRGLSVTRGAGYSYLGEGSVTLRQMIFDGLETANRVDAAKLRELQAITNITAVREQVALRATQAYINVLRARKALTMLNQHSKKIDDYTARIQTMVNEGAGDAAELQQAADVRIIVDGYIADFEGQLKAAEAAYIEAAGRMPSGDLTAPLPNLDLVPAQVEDAVSEVRTTHPTLLMADLNAQAVDDEIDAEEGILYPDVGGELSYLKSDKEDIIGGEVVDSRALMRVSWDISSGGAEFARIRKKKHEHYEALSQKEDVQRQIERDVRLAYAEHETAVKQMVILKKRMELNQSLFTTYRTQFEGGKVKQLQLMQAENQLFTTKLEMMSGEYRLLSAGYQVLAGMGRLQESVNIAAAATVQADAKH